MTTRLLVLLVSLTVLPAMGMLWLMNRAAAMETAAGQQQVLEAYRGQLRLVRSRLDPDMARPRCPQRKVTPRQRNGLPGS